MCVRRTCTVRLSTDMYLCLVCCVWPLALSFPLPAVWGCVCVCVCVCVRVRACVCVQGTLRTARRRRRWCLPWLQSPPRRHPRCSRLSVCALVLSLFIRFRCRTVRAYIHAHKHKYASVFVSESVLPPCAPCDPHEQPTAKQNKEAEREPAPAKSPGCRCVVS